MFQIPSRIDEAAKLVEPINAKLKDVADQLARLAEQRENLVNDASTLKAPDFLQQCENFDIAELVAHQKELSALTDAASVLPNCVTYFEAELTSCESALAKAVKTVDAQLRKAGFAPEIQPVYGSNASAAIQRHEMMIREAESVRTTQAALVEASENLTAFRRVVDDVPNMVASKVTAIQAWARNRIFR